MCIHEAILADHIQAKIVEERSKYDAALVRTNNMLEQTKQLKRQVGVLGHYFDACRYQISDGSGGCC
jgi:hypothetical protein